MDVQKQGIDSAQAAKLVTRAELSGEIANQIGELDLSTDVLLQNIDQLTARLDSVLSEPKDDVAPDIASTSNTAHGHTLNMIMERVRSANRKIYGLTQRIEV